MPRTREEWESIAKEFEEKWNVFNTIGAMDGKHIRISCPKRSGSHYFNYKNYHSIVLFALADANYKFIYVDVGTNGRVGDSGVYAKSRLKQCLTDISILNIPDSKVLPNTNINAPYVVIADDAFPLGYRIMKPYPLKDITREERVCNYRFSRGRRMIESSFGILATRFRVFLTSINLSPDKVKTITLAACVLHNMLVEKRKYLYTQQEVVTDSYDGNIHLNSSTEEQRQEMQAISRQVHASRNRSGREIRDEFKRFYNGPGRVSWQQNYL